MIDWNTWISAIVMPILSALVWWIWRVQNQLSEIREVFQQSIADFKLDVAKNYASNASLREVEARLVSHLNRIEAKLDFSRREPHE